MKKIILGAGIAGLGAYYADNEADIYEASDSAGGYATDLRSMALILIKRYIFHLQRTKL